MSDAMSQEQLEAVMGLIINAGNAKSDAMEAIQAAKTGDFALAQEKLEAADHALVEAHHSQTGLLTEEASGTPMTLTLLAVHSQDHLMTSITFNDMAKEVVELYKRLGNE
ncbi:MULTISPECIES: PTS lactose/cellobiose transporter subunit IIA [Enterococcus]|uniref:PTS lactose/cellobiose transporter subunit IIA n=1 Tax=Enterococcus xiangfangensis TaxID=1296537 RepID=A0ABU3FAS4_9ENTE|nr:MULTISPECIES: PTS lactose/cellobiose transporter subunit IIA [Enterococcus]MBM7712527.1 PTS system cellobiose-specific IIA component [Enterococcus xiangfangensis]MDT2759769.1 PTS lactose/cellobiose transporter subunit IIA [Enterococcus xiangfangensis]NBK08868.1 PTS lactose/cellobiose transporter subunit IIA [Enterococcus asini]